MIEHHSMHKMTHDLSNIFMILEGYISLMQLDAKHIKPENIQKLSDTMENATIILSNFKSSDEYQLLSSDNKKT